MCLGHDDCARMTGFGKTAVIGNSRLTTALFLMLLTPGLPVAATETDEQMSPVADHMHEKLTLITFIRSAVIAGSLEDARKPAIQLADQETIAGLPEVFRPFIAQMRTYARHVIEAPDPVSSAESVSRMAQTCGACHVASGISLEFGYDQLPRQDMEDVVTHMQRHQWAMDRLWEGLIGPSDKAWQRGIDMLIDVPLASEDVTTADEHFEAIDTIAGRIHALGRMGSETVTADARSELYGEILGQCASCHSLLRRGPAH